MHVGSWKVTKFAVRPAGKPDKCFYCNEKLGDEHKSDCVIRERTVVVDISFRMVRAIPEDWDKEQIEFQLNDGRFCMDNILDELNDLSERLGCLCGVSEAQLIREATPEDEKEYKISIEKIKENE